MPDSNKIERFAPTRDQLLASLDDVYYEIDQMVRTILLEEHWSLIAALRDCGTTITNALLESRLLHIRSLLEFFQREQRTIVKRKELDDVLSKDYGYQAAPIDIDAAYIERLNKDLAHLTYARIERTAESKKWPLVKVVVPILKRCDDFIGFVATSDLLKSQRSKVDNWNSLRARIQAQLTLVSRNTK